MTGGTRTPMPALHKELLRIAIFAVGVALLLNLLDSGVALNFVMMALYAALLAQAWNILGGYGGQFSFGHALFFGTGAYVQAIAQIDGPCTRAKLCANEPGSAFRMKLMSPCL